jgi:hypothetical protein
MEDCSSPILDLIIIEKSASFIKLKTPLKCGTAAPQLMGENHLMDLLEEGKIDRDKSTNLFSFKVKAIDTFYVKNNYAHLKDFRYHFFFFNNIFNYSMFHVCTYHY